MAYEELEPFGPLADQFSFGQIAATVANVNRGRDQPAYSPEFFMPALKRTIDAQARKRVPVHLTDDQHAALMDATLFGVAKK